jgi:hypothetical protein
LSPPSGHFPVLRHSTHLAQVQQTNQSSIVIPVNFSQKIPSQETGRSQRQTLLHGVYGGISNGYVGITYKVILYPILAVNILRMPCIPKF